MQSTAQIYFDDLQIAETYKLGKTLTPLEDFFPPILFWFDEINNKKSFMPLNSTDDLVLTIFSSLILYGPPTFVVFAADTVTKHFQPGDIAASDLKKGDLLNAFDSGDFTIQEALTFTAATANSTYITYYPYIVNDNGEFVFSDPCDFDNSEESSSIKPGGRIPEALQYCWCTDWTSILNKNSVLNLCRTVALNFTGDNLLQLLSRIKSYTGVSLDDDQTISSISSN